MEETIANNLVELVVVGTLSLFTFFGGVLLFVILYQKKVIRSQKEKQDLETTYQKDLLHSHIQTQENERQRIAADLHDGIGASLAAIRLMINQVVPETDKDKKLLAECKEAIQSTANSAREISHDLLPPSLGTLGLVKVLRRMCKNLNSSDLNFIFKTDVETNLSADTELALFRIVQEMINNTVKHAEATKINITFLQTEQGYTFTYADNGKGFKVDSTSGLGMRNIESRLQMIGAKHTFFSKPKKESGIKILLAHHAN